MTMANNQLSAADVLRISEKHLPLLVLSDNLWAWYGDVIKKHTKGEYNHAMWLYRPGILATQGATYHEADALDYMDGFRFKLWHNPDWTGIERYNISKAIEAKLARRWWRRLYDPLGIVGQALRLPWLNNPWRDFCSESAAKMLREVEPKIARHPSPADLDRTCKASRRMECYGVYDPNNIG